MKKKNKKIMIGILIALAIFFLLPNVLATCSDSDGLNYQVKGYININGQILYDFCSTLQPGYVAERICSGSDASGSTLKNCKDYGSSWDCIDGACKQSQQCAPGYFCPSGKSCFNSYYYCGTLGDNSYYKQYKNSDCSITTSKFYCSSGQTCKDGIGCQTQCQAGDFCPTGKNCFNSYYYCSTLNSNQYFKGIRNSDCSTGSVLYSCPSGQTCKDGVGCQTQCTAGSFCPSGKNCFNSYYYCSSTESNAYFKGIRYSDCSSGSEKFYCSSGQTCKEGVGCQTPQQSCTDSDGLNDKTKGSVTTILEGRSLTTQDKCSTLNPPDTLVEYFCQSNWIASSNINCKEKYGEGWTCNDGICFNSGIGCNKGEDICPTGKTCNKYLMPFVGTHEYYCSSLNNKQIIYNTLTGERLPNGQCNYGSNIAKTCGDNKECKNGVCTGKITCTDSDNKKDTSVKGKTYGFFANGEEYENWDFCSVSYPNRVSESFCLYDESLDEWSPNSEFIDCSEGNICSEGACIKPGECPLQKCEDCGNGLKNLCDKVECDSCSEKLGCSFTSTYIGGENWGTCETRWEECKSCVSWLYGKISKEKCSSKTIAEAKWYSMSTWYLYLIGGEITQNNICPYYLGIIGFAGLFIIIIIIGLIVRRRRRK